MNFGFFGFPAFVWGIAMAIAWLVIGWRAMRAHERLADATEETARQNRSDPPAR